MSLFGVRTWASQLDGYPDQIWSRALEGRLNAVYKALRHAPGIPDLFMAEQAQELRVRKSRLVSAQRQFRALGCGRWVVLRFSRGVVAERRELLLRAPDEDTAHKWRLRLRGVARALWESGELQRAEAVLLGGGGGGAPAYSGGAPGHEAALAVQGRLLFKSVVLNRPN